MPAVERATDLVQHVGQTPGASDWVGIAQVRQCSRSINYGTNKVRFTALVAETVLLIYD
jgi:hypothetical protein